MPPEERSLANVLILAYWDLFQTSNLQNCQIINLYYFMPQVYGDLTWQQQEMNADFLNMWIPQGQRVA